MVLCGWFGSWVMWDGGGGGGGGAMGVAGKVSLLYEQCYCWAISLVTWCPVYKVHPPSVIASTSSSAPAFNAYM